MDWTHSDMRFCLLHFVFFVPFVCLLAFLLACCIFCLFANKFLLSLSLLYLFLCCNVVHCFLSVSLCVCFGLFVCSAFVYLFQSNCLFVVL